MFLTRKCLPMDELALCVPQLAGVSGVMCNQHNLHRTGHIQICKQQDALSRFRGMRWSMEA